MASIQSCAPIPARPSPVALSSTRCFTFKQLNASGKEIVGFDVNEVSAGGNSGDAIDGIVGARVLYKLCNYMVAK